MMSAIIVANCFSIFALFGLLTIVRSLNGDVTMMQYYKKHTDSNTVAGSGVIVSKAASRSEFDCARSCLGDQRCVMFTYNAVVTQCSTYNTSTLVAGSYVGSGTDLFIRQWLSAACTSDSDCYASHSVCFKGKCLCTPGLYYSVSNVSCVTTCAQADLQNSFQHYDEAGLSPVTTCFVAYMSSSAACIDKCTTMAACVTVDWRIDDKLCVLMNFTVTPGFWVADAPGYDFFSRNCA